MNASPDIHAHLLGRDGHLTELTVDRYLYDDLGVDEREAFEAHTATCGACREAVEAVRSFDAGVALAPPAAAEPSSPLPASLDAARERQSGRRGFSPAWAGAMLAAAAGLFLMMRPGPDLEPRGDGILLRGGDGFALEVWVTGGLQSRQVTDGDAVLAGERFSFRAAADEDGHLIVVGLDGNSETYVCFPQRAGGQSAPFAATREPADLHQAMQFDSTPGTERLVALHCDAPLHLDAFRDQLVATAARVAADERLPDLQLDGGVRCAQREVRLRKVEVSAGE